MEFANNVLVWVTFVMTVHANAMPWLAERQEASSMSLAQLRPGLVSRRHIDLVRVAGALCPVCRAQPMA